VEKGEQMPEGHPGTNEDNILAKGKFAWTKENPFCFWIHIAGMWYRICTPTPPPPVP